MYTIRVSSSEKAKITMLKQILIKKTKENYPFMCLPGTMLELGD